MLSYQGAQNLYKKTDVSFILLIRTKESVKRLERATELTPEDEDKLTFFMRAEELQLFLLLPPQRVDYCDGQPERLLGVTV